MSASNLAWQATAGAKRRTGRNLELRERQSEGRPEFWIRERVAEFESPVELTGWLTLSGVVSFLGALQAREVVR